MATATGASSTGKSSGTRSQPIRPAAARSSGAARWAGGLLLPSTATGATSARQAAERTQSEASARQSALHSSQQPQGYDSRTSKRHLANGHSSRAAPCIRVSSGASRCSSHVLRTLRWSRPERSRTEASAGQTVQCSDQSSGQLGGLPLSRDVCSRQLILSGDA